MGSNQNRKPHQAYLNTFILHFRPRTIPEQTLKFNLTWGLGGMAFVLVALLLGTGLLLKFYYLPSPEKAYASILHLQNNVLFGRLIRNIHHWSANLALVVVFLHFIRVFLTGAFLPPRRFNWVVGLCLFLLVLLSNFTGYLLPWDQLSYWAVTISMGMLEYIPVGGRWFQELIQGGTEVGPATLSNFYALHTAILPGLLIALLLFHFWRVRKAGGVVVPGRPGDPLEKPKDKAPTIPNLLVRELTVALVLIACILVFSTLFDAPLQSKANPGLSPNPTKAPWYFMGIQELLLHFHPLFSLFVIPLCMLAGLFILPYLNYPSNSAGIWMISIKGRKMALMAVVFAVIITIGGILAHAYIISSPSTISNTQSHITGGLLPFVIILAVMLGFYVTIKRLFSANRNEAVQALLVFLLTAFIILTVMGICFRGAGMKPVWT
ncbi:MAG: cytochrome bc complex cytochrome b subunit [Deltaproteobacteria bacterium]|nr:cytochrome bc complex cytochrome b subunit [Deltaproteobacteria bacterium]